MPLHTIGNRIATMDTRRVKSPPKTVDPYYLTAEHKAWRIQVMKRAGWRCEHIDPSTGMRCTKRAPTDRLFADHIRERKHGGDPTALANGRALCGSHHTAKTAQARAERVKG
jgi:hypothetical protein